MAEVRIGVSGWNYRHWRGQFYPPGLTQKRELEYAAGCFGSIEVNGTFYGLTSPTATRRWYAAAPDDFVYAVKGSRFITHNKKLTDAEGPLANFLAAGVLELADKLGPILWQLSGNYRFDLRRVAAFFEMLPQSMDQARDLARRHDERVTEPAFGPGVDRPLRHVLEIRHESFFTEELVGLARAHGVALAFSHSSRWRYTEEITADFIYVRVHGPDRLYDSPYGSVGLERWAKRVKAWNGGQEPCDPSRITSLSPPPARARDVYFYFDNDGHAYAPREALELQRLTAGAPTA